MHRLITHEQNDALLPNLFQKVVKNKTGTLRLKKEDTTTLQEIYASLTPEEEEEVDEFLNGQRYQVQMVKAKCYFFSLTYYHN
jgi:hypothetical protein